MPRTKSAAEPPRFRVFETALGWVACTATSHGVIRIQLPERNATTARRKMRAVCPEASEDATLLPDFIDRIQRYFAGEKNVRFDVAVDWADASDFLRDVWQACRRIGYGRTVTYKQLAERVGRPRAARAIGLAMRMNRLPILVPCHRVLKSDGSLGGFSATRGVALKEQMLELEAR